MISIVDSTTEHYWALLKLMSSELSVSFKVLNKQANLAQAPSSAVLHSFMGSVLPFVCPTQTPSLSSSGLTDRYNYTITFLIFIAHYGTLTKKYTFSQLYRYSFPSNFRQYDNKYTWAILTLPAVPGMVLKATVTCGSRPTSKYLTQMHTSTVLFSSVSSTAILRFWIHTNAPDNNNGRCYT